MSGKREFDDSNDGNRVPTERRVRNRVEASHAASKQEQNEVFPPKGETSVKVKAKNKKAKGEVNGMSFPERLMQIMEHHAYWDAITWSTDGRSFGIKPETFTEKVIDTHFQGGLFESMQKRLSRWGFQRIQMHVEFTGSWITYHHPLFQRGKPELFRNLSSAEMLDMAIKSKDVSSSPTKKMTPSQPSTRKGEPQNALPSQDSQATCTSPLLTTVRNSTSLEHPLSINFVHSQNLSRLTTRDLSPPSRDFLQVTHHRPNLLSLPQQQLLNYLQRAANPTLVPAAASSDRFMGLSRLQHLAPIQAENERFYPLASNDSRSQLLDELRVASLSDDELLTLYFRSRQL